MRYWYLDSANMVMLQLFDKGYYDYDFEIVKKEIRWEDTVRSDEEIRNIMAGFGIGTAKKKMDTEQLQSYIIKEENYGK